MPASGGSRVIRLVSIQADGEKRAHRARMRPCWVNEIPIDKDDCSRSTTPEMVSRRLRSSHQSLGLDVMIPLHEADVRILD